MPPNQELQVSAIKEEISPVQESQRPAKPKLKGMLLFATGATAISGCLYGYDTGIISGALLEIRNDFHLQHTMQEVVASAILVGAVLGALSCGWLFERLGRKHTFTLIAAVYMLGAVASSTVPNPVLLASARVLLGLAVGGSSQTGPVYVAEIAPADRRGHFVTTFNVAIGIGIFAANLVSSGLQGHISWRWMIAAAIAPAAILFLCTLKIPESPTLASLASAKWIRPARSSKRSEVTKVQSTRKSNLFRRSQKKRNTRR
jgi:MFS family permease